MKVIKNGSKFEAIGPNGEVLARSTVRASARYHGKKKLALISGSSSGAKAVISTPAKVQEFGINRRFEFVSKLVTMTGKKKAKSVIISGPGGLGKTYSVMEALQKAGLKDLSAISEYDIGKTFDTRKCFKFIKGILHLKVFTELFMRTVI